MVLSDILGDSIGALRNKGEIKMEISANGIVATIMGTAICAVGGISYNAVVDTNVNTVKVEMLSSSVADLQIENKEFNKQLLASTEKQNQILSIMSNTVTKIDTKLDDTIDRVDKLED